jgi:SAM-dependent methyltransferase
MKTVLRGVISLLLYVTVSQAEDRYIALVETLLGDAGEIDRLCGPPGAGRDALKDLYQRIFPRRARHALGEYYTPDWLADHVLDELGYTGQRMLDPACGSGTFLVAAINRVRRSNAHLTRGDLLDKILDSVAGFDVNPLAVFTARANYRIAIRDLLPADREVPVELRDSILDPAPEWLGRADVVAGNPPWIAWDHLPQEYRERTKPLWRQYGLFSLTAAAARQGGGKKDLAALMLYAAADRYLRDGGKLGFVITQTLFQSRGAGDGFRRFRIGGDAPLGVFRVDDMVRLKPFAGASNWTSVVFLRKGAPTVYPVRYVRWNPRQECAAQLALDRRARGRTLPRRRPVRLHRAHGRLLGRRQRRLLAARGRARGDEPGRREPARLRQARGGVRPRRHRARPGLSASSMGRRWALPRAAVGAHPAGAGSGHAPGPRREPHAGVLPAHLRLSPAVRSGARPTPQ